jgi:hypothetical protein
MMGAWFLRNWYLFGSLMAPGASRTLWLTDYNQTFSYPASMISFDNWISAGLLLHIQARWEALLLNLQNLLVVQGAIVLLPVVIIGIWSKRRDKTLQFIIWMWLATLFLMTVVFPYAGSRGGYLHSAAAFQIIFWALFPVGLNRISVWGERVRNLPVHRTMVVFSVFAIITNMAIGGWFFNNRVIGSDQYFLIWDKSNRVYENVGDYLIENGFSKDTVVLVNNPPGFFVATRFPAVVIPNGDIDVSLAVARMYNASVLVLEENQVNLAYIYNNPLDTNYLDFLTTIDGAQIFRIWNK